MRIVGCFLDINILGHLVVGAAVICTSANAGGRDKYLAAAGPTPMRFELDGLRLDPAKVLPPLVMSDAEAGSTTTTTTTISEPIQEVRPPQIKDKVIERDITETVAVEAMTPGMKVEPTETKQNPVNQISPQILLRYFAPNGTNEVLVPYPLEFTPPAPKTSSGGSSSAVYSSPPAP